MKSAKKLIALLMVLTMVFSLAACGSGDDTPEDTNQPSVETPDTPSNDETPAPEVEEPSNTSGSRYVVGAAIQPDDASVAALWSEEATADGWIKVTNPDGETLGYDPNSGVNIIQVDGLAFKDLDKDGELDVYEDWRNDNETRAIDLAAHMSGEEIAPFLTHGGWGAFGDSYPADDAYVLGGGRGGVTRNVGSDNDSNVAHAKWVNSLEALCESLDYGIPALVSIDPNGQSGMIDTLALAATFDIDLAVEVGRAYSEQYRAAGVHALLGPQIDLASTAMARGNGTYGEDPALTRDIAEAYVSGLQSTFDENGNDLGWGSDSVAAFIKHYTAAGAAEAGRDDHSNEYSVFPGNNFEAHLIAFHDGTFRLKHSSTGTAAGVMMNYAISYSEDGSLGELVGGAFSDYKYSLLEADGWHGYIVTDWVPISGGNGAWNMSNDDGYDDGQRAAIAVTAGMTSAGGYSNLQGMLDGWEIMKDDLGEDEALEIMRDRAFENIMTAMNIKLFENPYSSTEKARETNATVEALEFGLQTQLASIVMLKNDGTIKESTGDKLTAYVPYVYTPFSEGSSGNTPASWDPVFDLDLVAKYFNVVTDTVKDPSGTDPDGNVSHTENDIQRATDAQIKGCDVVLMGMTAPWTASTVEYDDDGNLLPVSPRSIQYGEYTATKARETSIAGDTTTEVYSDGYNMLERTTTENRSYNGNTAAQASNYGDLEGLQRVSGIVGGSNTKVIVLMQGANTGTMVWGEVEPMADAIIWSYSGNYDEALLMVAAGEYQPNGLLVIGMPKDMDATEVELEDVPRDQECYVDAAGNTYEFTFGLNWDGKINDNRVTTYSAAPLTKVTSFTYFTAK